MRKRAVGYSSHKKKSDRVRVDHKKDQWGETSTLERAMG